MVMSEPEEVTPPAPPTENETAEDAPMEEEGWLDLSGDGGVMKKILEAGDEVAGKPPQGYEVSAHYTGTLVNGDKFDSSRDRGQLFKFVIGTGNVIKGWDIGFASMNKGEKAILKCRSDYAYGDRDQGPMIKAGATLLFDVELFSFTPKAKEKWQMNAEELISQANSIKEEGTELFSEKRFEEAAARYLEAAEYASEAPEKMDPTSQEHKDAGALEVSCYLNASQACLSNKQYVDAGAHATNALEKHPDNVKALYRRGVARRHCGLLDKSKEDLMKAYQLEPKNKAVVKEMQLLKASLKVAKKKEKNMFGNLFGKGVSVYGDKESIMVHSGNNPRCFFDIKVGDNEPQRLTMELWANVCPKTCANFLHLCKGDKGKTPDGKPLHYKGSLFHRVIKDFMLQGGDFTNGDGTGGVSIYGDKFSDENFDIKHTKEGLLSMANAGPNTNGSQFFVTCRDTPHLDGRHVVFGCVIDGMDLVHKIEGMPTTNDRPNEDVIIVDCGELPSATEDGGQKILEAEGEGEVAPAATAMESGCPFSADCQNCS